MLRNLENFDYSNWSDNIGLQGCKDEMGNRPHFGDSTVMQYNQWTALSLAIIVYIDKVRPHHPIAIDGF